MYLQITKTLYQMLLAPRATATDVKRRELVLNVFLLGAVVLSLTAFLITFHNSMTMGASYTGAPPGISLAVWAAFSVMLTLSRYGMQRWVTYMFIGIFFLAATIPLVAKGVIVAPTLLIYGLIIVLTGVLLGTQASFVAACIASGTLLVFVGLVKTGRLHADPSIVTLRASYSDGVLCTIIFLLIAVMSSLTNRDIRQALKRAQASEAALRRERDNLEVKVRERTRELQEAQLAHTMQLQRFAEFGRVSATLIHDLATPLTAVSLSLAQLEDQRRTGVLNEAKEGAAAMERYVVAARQQLQQETEITDFNPASELRSHVLPQCTLKARQAGVHLEADLDSGITLHGSSVQFDHIVSNLVINAIDAYEDVLDRRRKTVTVRLWQHGKQVRLIVRDHGVGIQRHQMSRLFDAFYTTKYASENLGLGLALVKHMVEASFRGNIAVRSSRRSGTRFTVKIPLP